MLVRKKKTNSFLMRPLSLVAVALRTHHASLFLCTDARAAAMTVLVRRFHTTHFKSWSHHIQTKFKPPSLRTLADSWSRPIYLKLSLFAFIWLWRASGFGKVGTFVQSVRESCWRWSLSWNESERRKKSLKYKTEKKREKNKSWC